MKKIHYIAAIVFLLISARASAQMGLHIDPNALDSLGSGPFVLDENTPVNTPAIDIVVNNLNGAAFDDTIYFGYTITAGGATASYTTAGASTGSGIDFAPQRVQIGPQGRQALSSLIFHFTTPRFGVGSSTVVIWPIVARQPGMLVDSARTTVNIIASTVGIAEQSQTDQKVYMSGSNLIISTAENQVGEIRIYNTIGELVYAQKMTPLMQIPMFSYTSGLYIVELLSADGMRSLHKVFNQGR